MGLRRFAIVLAVAAVAACNALTGASDLVIDDAEDGGTTPSQPIDAARTDSTPPGVDAGLDATSQPDVDADAGPPPPLCNPADSTLMLCVSFEGVVKDDSASAFPVNATAVTFEKGRVGQAARTTASTVTIAESPSMTTAVVTMEAFVRPSTLPATGRSILVDFEARFAMGIQANGALLCIAGGTMTAGTVPVGVWSHVACVHDAADETRAYVNGVLVGKVKLGALLTGPGGAAIGMDSPLGDALDGLIDELRVFRAVRSDAEIAAAARRAD